MNPLVNIILPVLNRPQHTRQCIESLYRSIDKDLFNLTVIDDGSNQITRDRIESMRKDYGFYILNNVEGKSVGPGGAKNQGTRFLTEENRRAKYLYFSDNDVYFKDEWLTKLVMIYETVSKERVALLGASCHPYLQNCGRIEIDVNSSIYEKYSVGIKDAVSGYSQLITWDIRDRFGEFTTQEGLEKKTGRSDDWEYCQRINQSGLLCGSVEPELVIPCGKTDTYGDLAVGQETFQKHEGVFIG